jgi:ribosomal protein S18 acetylase RimI-like enzyme
MAAASGRRLRIECGPEAALWPSCPFLLLAGLTDAGGGSGPESPLRPTEGGYVPSRSINSGEAIIRPAVAADAHAIAEVHVATWQAAYAGLLPADLLNSLDVDRRTADWSQRLEAASAGSFVLVLERDGTVRGFVWAGPARDADCPQAGQIHAIYVDPSYQGGGGGSQLLTAAARRLAGQFGRAVLWVLAGNAAARAFYESQGWRLEGAEKQETFGAQASTEVRYVRNLQETAALGM